MSKHVNELAQRMAALDATAAEVGNLIGRDPEQIEAMRKGDAEIDPDARVLLRTFLADDPHAASAALQRLRGTYTHNLLGDGMTQSGIEAVPGYGGFTGTDGGGPK
jgi:hypothetical protein